MVDEVPDHNIIIKEFPNTNLPIARLSNSRDRLFFRHWEIQIIFPMFVLILSTSGIIFYIICIHQYILSTKLKIFCLINILISFFMFIWSYISAACMDPGFLPYDWFTTQRMKYSWVEQLEGLGVTREQHEFALSHPRPLGSCYSHAAGRFVLRPDHICGWIANWVGKRNHKQFILMMLYGALFAFSLAWPRLLVNTQPHESNSIESLGGLALVIECIFIIGLTSGFISQVFDLKFNTTKHERFKKKNKNFKDPKAIRNLSGFSDVCGNGSKCFWVLPTPAFGDNIPFEIEEPSSTYLLNQPHIHFKIQSVPILDENDIL